MELVSTRVQPHLAMTVSSSTEPGRYEFEPMFVKTKGKFLPEKRLGITVYGALLFPVTMFWFAWSAVRVHWISPVLAGTLWTSATDWMRVHISQQSQVVTLTLD